MLWITIALIVLGFFWRPAWGILILIWFAEWASTRWKELLDAIRGRRQSSSEDEQGREHQQEEVEQQQEYERRIAVAHQKTPFKHIPGQPWGDPSSYVRASTPKELKQGQEALVEREVEIREHEEALKRQEADNRQRDEAREREARGFLARESERVQKEREEREAVEKRKREAHSRWTH
jgi:hypothetical protein